jgi:DNA-binding transcriptional ArsR family regulator
LSRYHADVQPAHQARLIQTEVRMLATAIRDETTLDAAVEALKFLSDKNRLRILALLTEAETCVCDLIDALDLSQTLVSYHLAKLRKAGLVRARRDAQWVHYSLDPEAWDRLIAPLGGLLERRTLPPAAAYGANRRCDDVLPDPTRGACSCGDSEGNVAVNGKVAVVAARSDEADLNGEVIDRLADAVLDRLISRLLARPERD